MQTVIARLATAAPEPSPQPSTACAHAQAKNGAAFSLDDLFARVRTCELTVHGAAGSADPVSTLGRQ